jgi:hypothetical protein
VHAERRHDAAAATAAAACVDRTFPRPHLILSRVSLLLSMLQARVASADDGSRLSDEIITTNRYCCRRDCDDVAAFMCPRFPSQISTFADWIEKGRLTSATLSSTSLTSLAHVWWHDRDTVNVSIADGGEFLHVRAGPDLQPTRTGYAHYRLSTSSPRQCCRGGRVIKGERAG